MMALPMSTNERGNAGHSGRSSEERLLIRRCIAGERSAQETLYHANKNLVTATLFRVLGDRSELEDLVQEVFVIAFRGLSKFRQDAKLSTWLYRISLNVALGTIRKRKRRPPPILQADPSERDVRTNQNTPESLVHREESRAQVYRLMDMLSPKKRIVLFLHEIEGHELVEIARILDVNPVTVRTRLYYAKKDFYEFLANDEKEAANEAS